MKGSQKTIISVEYYFRSEYCGSSYVPRSQKNSSLDKSPPYARRNGLSCWVVAMEALRTKKETTSLLLLPLLLVSSVDFTDFFQWATRRSLERAFCNFLP